MSDEKIGEETYSLIFSSLKHPIRRRILRMLATEPQTFSKILDTLSIDSGHLNYHLENLGELITHTSDGKYRLSSIGIAAVRLMSGVEEHPTLSIPSRVKNPLNVFIKIVTIILMLGLIASSLYFTNYTQYAGGNETGLPKASSIKLPPNQTFEYNITIVYKKEAPFYLRTTNNSHYEEREPPTNTLIDWEKCSLWFDFTINQTFYFSIRVIDPMGEKIKEINWIGELSGDTKGWGCPDITQPGTYRLEIKNIDTKQLDAILGITIKWDRFEKPYFYYGITGIIVALLYPALIFVNEVLKRV